MTKETRKNLLEVGVPVDEWMEQRRKETGLREGQVRIELRLNGSSARQWVGGQWQEITLERAFEIMRDMVQTKAPPINDPATD